MIEFYCEWKYDHQVSITLAEFPEYCPFCGRKVDPELSEHHGVVSPHTDHVHVRFDRD